MLEESQQEMLEQSKLEFLEALEELPEDFHGKHLKECLDNFSEGTPAGISGGTSGRIPGKFP